MSLKFSSFPDVADLELTDQFLIARADPGSPSGFSNYNVPVEVMQTFFGGGGGTPSFFLLNDGVSKILLNDGTSFLKKNT
jgi:hypothetical protein